MISLENGTRSPAVFSALPLNVSLKEHQDLQAPRIVYCPRPRVRLRPERGQSSPRTGRTGGEQPGFWALNSSLPSDIQRQSLQNSIGGPREWLTTGCVWRASASLLGLGSNADLFWGQREGRGHVGEGRPGPRLICFLPSFKTHFSN